MLSKAEKHVPEGAPEGAWARRPDLRRVAEAVERRLRRQDGENDASRAPAGGPFAGLPEPGAVHEWLAGNEEDGPLPRVRWLPPLGAMIHVARAALERDADARRAVLWIGRRCRPHPVALAQRSGSLLDRSVFVEAPRAPERLWAIDAALRCRAVAVVVADAEGLDMSASRRLQLAAEAGGVLGLLARPPWERRALSAARTRWRIAPAPPDPHDRDQGWTVELLRCKGMRPTSEDVRRWTVRWTHATSDVRVAADVSDRASSSAALAGARRAV